MSDKDQREHPDCESCRDPNGPPHDASDRCESGKHPHCSCDVCF